jgi:hypothetical protein
MSLRITPSYAILNQDAFRLRVRYENVENRYEHRYFIECIDSRNWTLIQIDSNVIDEEAVVTLDEALDRTKRYLKSRFNYDINHVEIVPQLIERYNRQLKNYEPLEEKIISLELEPLNELIRSGIKQELKNDYMVVHMFEIGDRLFIDHYESYTDSLEQQVDAFIKNNSHDHI